MPKAKPKPPTTLLPGFLTSPRIRLRNFRLSDAQPLVDHLKDLQVTRYTYIPHPYTLEYAHKFLRRVARLRLRGTGIVFAIEEITSGQLIGAIGIMHLDRSNRKAEFGYWLAKSRWGHGITTEAVNLFVTYAFETLKLARLQAHVFHPNIASQKVLTKCGFVLEGRLRKSDHHRGVWLDNFAYSMLDDEYKSAATKGIHR